MPAAHKYSKALQANRANALQCSAYRLLYITSSHKEENKTSIVKLQFHPHNASYPLLITQTCNVLFQEPHTGSDPQYW